MILTIAYIAFTAFALTTSATPDLPLGDNGEPTPLGKDPDNRFTDLTFTLYTEPHCKGDSQSSTGEGAYGDFVAYQMASYTLSRSLYYWETLDFFTGDGTGLPSKYSTDYALNGDVYQSCMQYDSTAGVNATTHDDQGHGRWNGCHDLNNHESCANIWINDSAP